MRVEVHERERFFHPRGRLGRARAETRDLQRERDVLKHRHVRPDRIALEHHADIAFVRCNEGGRIGRRHDAAADRDRAAVGALQAGETTQRRRLAAAARAEQREELAGLHAKRHAVDRGNARLSVARSASRDPLTSTGARCGRDRAHPFVATRSGGTVHVFSGVPASSARISRAQIVRSTMICTSDLPSRSLTRSPIGGCAASATAS